MPDILSQAEVDELLAAGESINSTSFETIKDFEKYLTERRQEPEKPYGIFQQDVSMIRFFDDKKGESVLSDIVRKNEKENMGNITIPNTDIRLVNYSICPKCDTIFSFKDLKDYYSNPAPDTRFSDKTDQARRDTRMRCKECGEYFLPSLVIVDRIPKNEVQFLCRVQTVDAIESFYHLHKGRQVLTKNKSNVLKQGNKMAIVNDVNLEELSQKPVLVSNLLQYTPPDLVLSLVEGKNLANRDPLYGVWRSLN